MLTEYLRSHLDNVAYACFCKRSIMDGLCIRAMLDFVGLHSLLFCSVLVFEVNF